MIEVVDKDHTSSVATAAISGLIMIARERESATSDDVAGALARTVESRDDPTVRASAATNLADLDTKADPAIATLRKAARDDPIESVRKAAGTTLRRIGHADLPELKALGADDETMALISGMAYSSAAKPKCKAG